MSIVIVDVIVSAPRKKARTRAEDVLPKTRLDLDLFGSVSHNKDGDISAVSVVICVGIIVTV